MDHLEKKHHSLAEKLKAGPWKKKIVSPTVHRQIISHPYLIHPKFIYESDLSFFLHILQKKTPPPPKPESPTSNNQPPGSTWILSIRNPAYHAIIPSPSLWINGFTDGAQKPGHTNNNGGVHPTKFNMETWKWWVFPSSESPLKAGCPHFQVPHVCVGECKV